MTQVEMLLAHIGRTLCDLNVPPSDDAYHYPSLAHCLIDAVYSIGVAYESTQRTVRQFCRWSGWPILQTNGIKERTISELLEILQPYENRWEVMANDVFKNRQRTSTRSGVLKAEAVYRFAKALQQFGIETFADILQAGLRDDVRCVVQGIPGQGSGLSYKYFPMLAGQTDYVKADRMVTRFVADALGLRYVPSAVCERLIREASTVLRTDFPNLTATSLDYAIWSYQREQNGAAPKGCHRAASAR
jgi:hypothetical protein